MRPRSIHIHTRKRCGANWGVSRVAFCFGPIRNSIGVRFGVKGSWWLVPGGEEVGPCHGCGRFPQGRTLSEVSNAAEFCSSVVTVRMKSV